MERSADQRQSGKILLGASVSIVALVVLIVAATWWVLSRPPRSPEATNSPLAIVTPSPEATLPRCTRETSFSSIASALERAGEVCHLYVRDEPLDLLLTNVEKFTNLKILALPNKNLTRVPTHITQLSSLEVLLLDGNHISTLPKELSTLKNLRYVSLRNNPIDHEGAKPAGELMLETKFVF